MTEKKETMLTNIMEEEQVLQKILKEFQIKNQGIIDILQNRTIQNILILATGSSINAAKSAKYFMEMVLGVAIDIKEPFNYYHYEKINQNLDLVIAISQSGKSASTISALEYIKKNSNKTTLAITANPNNLIGNYADMVLDFNFGIEKVGFVTKGFSATVLNLFLLSIFLGGARKFISNAEKNNYLVQIEEIVGLIPQMIENTEKYLSKNKEILRNGVRFVSIGYGACYGIAKEFETKFTETVRCPSQGFELEAYMHGPYLEANKDHVIFYLDNSGKLSRRLHDLRVYMDPYIKKSIVIGINSGDINVKMSTKMDENLVVLLLMIPIQLMSYRIAEWKGINLEVKIFKDFDLVLKSKV